MLVEPLRLVTAVMAAGLLWLGVEILAGLGLTRGFSSANWYGGSD
jgi:hypothetical protein